MIVIYGQLFVYFLVICICLWAFLIVRQLHFCIKRASLQLEERKLIVCRLIVWRLVVWRFLAGGSFLMVSNLSFKICVCYLSIITFWANTSFIYLVLLLEWRRQILAVLLIHCDAKRLNEILTFSIYLSIFWTSK